MPNTQFAHRCSPYRAMTPNELIGKKLVAVNYMTSFEGLDDFSKDPKADFDYLPFGGLHIKLSDEKSYCIADYNTTKLGTAGVGFRLLQSGQTDLTAEKSSGSIQAKWNDKIGQTITGISFYLNKEEWNNFIKNETYPASLQIDFENGKSVFYFCGDVEGFNDLKGHYELIGGRDSGILFFDKIAFKKYGLDKVHKKENYTGYNPAI